MAANNSITETLQSENNQLRQQIATLEQTVAELRQSRHMLQLVLDNLPLAVAWKDRDLIYQGCNRQFAQDAGLASSAAIIGKSDLDLYVSTRAEQQRAADQQVITSGTREYHREEAQEHDGGLPTWQRISRIPVYDDGKTPCAILGVYEDITVSKQEEGRLRMFENLVEHASDAIAIIAPDETLIYANPAFLRLYGYNELTEVSFANMLAPEEYERLPAMLQDVQTSGVWRDIVTYRRADGTTFSGQVSGFLIRDSKGEPREIAAIIRDITQQIEQEQKFRTFYALVENAPDGYGVASLDGFTVYANRAYHSMLKLDDMTGTVFTEYVAPQDHGLIPEIIEQVGKTGSWQGRINYQRSDGSIFTGHLSGFIAVDETGQPLAMVGVVRDLTEQIRAEEERAALQEQIIVAQQAALRELSTPLIPLADDLVAMPLIGSIDSARAQQILEALLQGVAEHQAAMVIIDITGVQVVDTQVANALVRAAQAVKLLGAQVVLTGIRPEIAQTLVSMGADLAGIITHGTLQTGIAYAMGQATRKDTRKVQAETDTALWQNPTR